jgi:hypothetical protein
MKRDFPEGWGFTSNPPPPRPPGGWKIGKNPPPEIDVKTPTRGKFHGISVKIGEKPTMRKFA